jgi:hypothetical protein
MGRQDSQSSPALYLGKYIVDISPDAAGRKVSQDSFRDQILQKHGNLAQLALDDSGHFDRLIALALCLPEGMRPSIEHQVKTLLKPHTNEYTYKWTVGAEADYCERLCTTIAFVLEDASDPLELEECTQGETTLQWLTLPIDRHGFMDQVFELAAIGQQLEDAGLNTVDMRLIPKSFEELTQLAKSYEPEQQKLDRWISRKNALDRRVRYLVTKVDLAAKLAGVDGEEVGLTPREISSMPAAANDDKKAKKAAVRMLSSLKKELRLAREELAEHRKDGDWRAIRRDMLKRQERALNHAAGVLQLMNQGTPYACGEARERRAKKEADQKVFLASKVAVNGNERIGLDVMHDATLDAQKARIWSMALGIEGFMQEEGLDLVMATVTLPGKYHFSSDAYAGGSQADGRVALKDMLTRIRWALDNTATMNMGFVVTEPHKSSVCHAHMLIVTGAGEETKRIVEGFRLARCTDPDCNEEAPLRDWSITRQVDTLSDPDRHGHRHRLSSTITGTCPGCGQEQQVLVTHQLEAKLFSDQMPEEFAGDRETATRSIASYMYAYLQKNSMDESNKSALNAWRSASGARTVSWFGVGRGFAGRWQTVLLESQKEASADDAALQAGIECVHGARAAVEAGEDSKPFWAKLFRLVAKVDAERRPDGLSTTDWAVIKETRQTGYGEVYRVRKAFVGERQQLIGDSGKKWTIETAPRISGSVDEAEVAAREKVNAMWPEIVPFVRTRREFQRAERATTTFAELSDKKSKENCSKTEGYDLYSLSDSYSRKSGGEPPKSGETACVGLQDPAGPSADAGAAPASIDFPGDVVLRMGDLAMPGSTQTNYLDEPPF